MNLSFKWFPILYKLREWISAKTRDLTFNCHQIWSSSTTGAPECLSKALFLNRLSREKVLQSSVTSLSYGAIQFDPKLIGN